MSTTLKCGPYQSTAPLELSGGTTVEAKQLVYCHFHAGQRPTLHLPMQNRNNRWLFAKDGSQLAEPDAASLRPLKAEGVYRLREHFHPDQTHVVAAQSLVQLGYNRHAHPIIFFPTWEQERNALVFPSQGTRIPPDIYALLEVVQTRGPRRAVQIH